MENNEIIYFKGLFIVFGMYKCLPTHLYVHPMHAWCSLVVKGTGFPRTGVVDVWVLSGCPLEEQQVLLTTKPSLLAWSIRF